MKIKFNLNNETVETETTLSKRLLDVIREDFDLTGTKEGCAEGECGACLVFVDEDIVNSCLVPMANVIGKSVVTIESFAQTDDYKRIEGAFVKAGAENNPNPTPEEVREGLSGNLCRCTGYQSIFEAVEFLREGGYLNV
jgi:carbon-monoxide dehydrogenase small subunit